MRTTAIPIRAPPLHRCHPRDQRALSPDLKNGPSDPRRRLQLLLEQNSLIGREVLMSEDNLDHNCGDLIAFAEDDSTAPVYLKSTPSGYQIWAPLSMRQPRPIWDCRDCLSQLSSENGGRQSSFNER